MKKMLLVVAIFGAIFTILTPIASKSAAAASIGNTTTAYGKPHVINKARPNVNFGCYGLSCNNQDPAVTNCNQSYMTYVPITVKYNNQIVATGNNVFSSGCDANWTEGTLTSLGAALQVIIDTHDRNGHYQESDFPSGITYKGPAWPAYTNMVDGKNTTYSTIAVWPKDPNASHFVSGQASQ